VVYLGDSDIFSNLRVEDDIGTRAVVRVTTRVPVSCKTHYGAAAAALDRVATDPDMIPGTMTTMHHVPLENLVPGTTYFLQGVAQDADGTVHSTLIGSFTTGPGDATQAMTNMASQSQGSTIASVSSNWAGGANDSAFGVDHVIDGDMYTEWSTNGDGDGAWLVIDLGQARTLTHFAYRSRKMTDGTSIVTRFRLIFDDTVTIGPMDSPDPDTRYAFALSQPVMAQRVRFEAVTTSGGNTGAKELQLFSP
jgi:hypothetical protein